MASRNLPHVRALEFRADDQVKLLRDIATWFKRTQKAARVPQFLLSVHLDLSEDDLDEPEPYTATVYVDGDDLG